MKKIAILFVVAVLLPSLVLAWMAVRSLRDQEYALERQQSLLYQGVAESVAARLTGILEAQQRDFGRVVESLIGDGRPLDIVHGFDERLRPQWPLAAVGFCVSLTGEIFSPSPLAGAEARRFRLENDLFLSNRQSVEVYWNSPKGAINLSALDARDAASQQQQQQQQQALVSSSSEFAETFRKGEQKPTRNVAPLQQQRYDSDNLSRLSPAATQFHELLGLAQEGAIARFLQNRLHLLFWHRPAADTNLVFGSLVDLARLTETLATSLAPEPTGLHPELCVALLDDLTRPVALTHPGFQADWRRPFAATEIGEALPHWEVAVYRLNPDALSRSARTLRLTLGLLVLVLLTAIGTGGWLILNDLNRQLRLARLKTDFVSNVSHELKTPLTSIRMFAELLSGDRPVDAEKQRTYLGVITHETARLTRLINNVLDFARMERGEKRHHPEHLDLSALVRDLAASYQPQLEARGFHVAIDLPDHPVPVHADRDGLSQILVNLLSNAEKYAGDGREIRVELLPAAPPDNVVRLRVLDRGLGVPAGSEEKIFEQFYRAQDSLANGIQGSGLGLTLARQIARAHGGDVTCHRRVGGGSCFELRLPPGTPPPA